MHKFSNIIDVHSHAIFPIGAQAPMEHQPEWSVQRALDLMDENDIAACVLSVPDAANHASGVEARNIARCVNEKLAEIVSEHPSRFGALATLPAADPDGAVAELDHALDYLGMDGVCTSTSIQDIYLGEPMFDPWFTELDRRGSTLLIHPVVAQASRAVSLGLNASILEFMFDTTRMLTNMVLSGAKARFGNVRIISTHGGGTLPYLVERIQTLQAAFGAGQGRKTLSPEEIRSGFASFYYDLTAATSKAQLGALLELVPSSRLVMGFDIPFMPSSSFKPAVREVLAFEHFDEGDFIKIARENTADLFPALAARIGAS